jgi:putative tricarboxylic transport membrane protein
MVTDRVILVCTVIIAVVYLYATTLIPSLEIGDPLGPKAFPNLLGIGLLIAAGMLGMEIWAKRKANTPHVPASEIFDPVIVKMVACVAVWTAGYYAVFEKLGFVVATTIYLLGMMAWFNRGKWMVNILTAALFSGLTYLMFVKLDVSLPKGVLPF